jgi:ParB/RepB/Spo0J family partition protein
MPPASSEYRLIPISRIQKIKYEKHADLPEDHDANRPYYREHNKEFIDKLAGSIETEGLHQPIMVRPNHHDMGKFDLVFGNGRLKACRLLGWTEIPALVVDLDDDDVIMAREAENTIRNPLSKARAQLALRRWFERYYQKYPRAASPGYTGGVARGKQKSAVASAKKHQGQTNTGHHSEGAGFDHDPNQQEQQVERVSPSPTEMAAQITGKSPRAARNDLRIAKAFDTPTLDVLARLEDEGKALIQDELLGIAAIKDPQQRRDVVNLVASGMCTSAEAILKVCKPEDGTVRFPSGKVVVPEAPAEQEMSDEQWVKLQCADVLEKLTFQEVYIHEAILYRHIRDALATFRGATKKHVAEAKKGCAVRGPLVRAIEWLSGIDHPKTWLACGQCDGTGANVEGEKCKPCGGAAFRRN